MAKEKEERDEKEEKAEAPKEKKSKKSEAEEAEILQQVQVTLEKLVLDTALNKYDVILLARRWAYELKSKEGETRSLQELIAVSIQDILGDRVSHKMVQALPHFRSGRKPKTAPANILDALKAVAKKEERA